MAVWHLASAPSAEPFGCSVSLIASSVRRNCRRYLFGLAGASGGPVLQRVSRDPATTALHRLGSESRAGHCRVASLAPKRCGHRATSKFRPELPRPRGSVAFVSLLPHCDSELNCCSSSRKRSSQPKLFSPRGFEGLRPVPEHSLTDGLSGSERPDAEDLFGDLGAAGFPATTVPAFD
jgi:hypothetical protein